jgi:hypothetical protein
MDVSLEIEGLIKTVTERDIIEKIEKEFKEKEQLLKEDRKKFEWSSSESENNS